jgi:hypothetical protein
MQTIKHYKRPRHHLMHYLNTATVYVEIYKVFKFK